MTHHHAVHILGAGLVANQHNLLATLVSIHCVVGREVHLAHRGAGRRSQTRGEYFGGAGELRVQDLIEVIGRDAHDRLVLGDRPLRRRLALRRCHIDGHLQRGCTGALADTRLQHPQLALLDRELGVAHVLVVALETSKDRQQLAVNLREVQLHVIERLGVANAGDDVFALRVDQKVAVGLIFASGGVAGEADAGAAVVVAVAEYHRLHVDGCSQIVADAFAHSVRDCTGTVPTGEHCLDGTA